jgi:hypothetical protein
MTGAQLNPRTKVDVEASTCAIVRMLIAQHGYERTRLLLRCSRATLDSLRQPHGQLSSVVYAKIVARLDKL